MEWLAQGAMKPNTLQFANYLVIVREKARRPCVCLDNRKLSRKSVKDGCLVLPTEDLLRPLKALEIFSMLHLRYIMSE